MNNTLNNLFIAIVKKPLLRGKQKPNKLFRKGRGFSLPEIKAAGLTISEAKKLGISVDNRRRSSHNLNIEKLKQLKIKYFNNSL
jgi:large subunit ribosomal protein L13e